MQKPDSRGGRSDTAMLGEITAGTKQIARQANTCMILLSQLNRTIESRDDKKPQLADLRESGSIEQDADVVLFPYRPIYYLERSEPPAGPKRTSWVTECETSRRIMDVICAKQRAGPTGYDRQMYFAETDTIRDWAD
jgi:replicative DNA helicase